MALSTMAFSQNQVITLDVSADNVTSNERKVIEYGTDTTGVKFKLLENIGLTILISDTVFDVIAPGGWAAYSDELHLYNLPVGDTLTVIFKIDTVGFWSAYEAKWQFTKRQTSSLSINEVVANNCVVYPNPTNGILNINSNVKSLKVIDMSGKTVFSQTVNQDNPSFNLSTLNNGIYTAVINDNNKVKFLISKGNVIETGRYDL